MNPTAKPSGEYTTFQSEMPIIPERIAPAIESRKVLHELDTYLKGVKQADNTREAFKNLY